MATSWGLGTDAVRVANTGDSQDNLANVGGAEPAYQRAIVQRRMANNSLVEHRFGRSRSVQITQEGLTQSQRDALISLLNTSAALYFRDDITSAVYEVRPGEEINEVVRVGFTYDVSYSLISVSGAL